MTPPAKGRTPLPPKRKASKAVRLLAVGAVGTLMIAYCAAVFDDDEVVADCVDTTTQLADGSYVVVDDDYCDDGYHGPRGAFLWYYGGKRVGSRVMSGTTIRPGDVTITSRGGKEIQRGGFGGRGSGGS
ncbi:hypothetical protein [Thermoactinospora rubra]|uniref:hypothetical protein n=1 Tax=Thermoactinospora rubra TaxID=1088767 RepID=UPI00117EC8AC|nr:hypothetical protein [Thermoactinospora rubra]